MFHHLPRVSPKKLHASVELGCTRELGSSQYLTKICQIYHESGAKQIIRFKKKELVTCIIGTLKLFRNIASAGCLLLSDRFSQASFQNQNLPKGLKIKSFLSLYYPIKQDFSCCIFSLHACNASVGKMQRADAPIF